MLNVLADLTKSENFKSQSLYVTMKKVKSTWVSVLTSLYKCSRMVCSSNQHLVALKSYRILKIEVLVICF